MVPDTSLSVNSRSPEKALENAVAIRGQHRSSTWEHRSTLRHSSAVETSRPDHPLEIQLAELRREHDQLRHTLFQAAQVQRQLCGVRHLRRRPYEIASEIFPLENISGDFITVFEAGADIVFAIGDICGKGLAAGMWFAHIVASIRCESMVHRDPGAALTVVNDDLVRCGMDLPMTSLLLCRLQIATGKITYCNAGHPPGLLLEQNGAVEALTEGGPVLGVIAGARYASGRTVLNPGATLLGFSDGVVECGEMAGDQFGVDRVLEKAQAASGSAVGTLFSVLGAVEDFAGSRSREDDLAMMVVHRDSRF
jgi:serine phosphatase RsbU (regulator of sigma subunit)